MSASSKPLSRRRCAGSRQRGKVYPPRLMTPLLLCPPSMVAGDMREVAVQWDELPPLVERRDVETVLTNGVYVRGRVQKGLPDGLEMRVKKTSDAAVIPKGVQRIPCELTGVLVVRWKQGWARVLLTAVMYFGGGLGLALLHIGADEISGTRAILLTAGFATAGYLVGASVDSKRMRIVLTPTHPAREKQACASTEFEGGTQCTS